MSPRMNADHFPFDRLAAGVLEYSLVCAHY